MNKEDYVSLEVAKLLKEKGFDEPYFYFYHNSELYTLNGDIVCSECDNIHDGIIYPAPTLYEVQKRLREGHNIHIIIGVDDLDWWYQLCSADGIGAITDSHAGFKCYEEALNEGILKALKLI